MNAQLLLLLALAGPFCAFTRASPTNLPLHFNDSVTQMEIPYSHTSSDHPDILGNPPIQPSPAVLENLITEAATEKGPQELITEAATETGPQELITEAATQTAPQELSTEALPQAASTVVLQQNTTEEEEVETQQPVSTGAPAAETAAPTGEAEVVQTSDAETESSSDVAIKEKTGVELTSSQTAGIAIGTLLGVGIAVAVAIAVTRRMGKYSP